MASLSDILTRRYNNFRGVDFTGGVVPYYRSPDAVNMWRDYKDDDCIQTRPGMELLDNFSGEIYGLFFFEKNNITHVLVHVNTSLVEWTNYPQTPAQVNILKSVGMKPDYSRSFVFNDTLFIMDGINYLEFDGITLSDVEGTIPYTSYYRNPDGSSNLDDSTDTDTVYQPINMLSDYRFNRFIADGIATDYYLDDRNLSAKSIYRVEGTILDTDGIQTVVREDDDFSVDRDNGIITFTTAPSADSVVTIKICKQVVGHANRVKQCNLMCEFDNRIFVSGNPDFPNLVYRCQLNDPRYFADTAYQQCGVDIAPIRAIIPGNSVLWVFKEINQNSSSVYYLTPTLDEMYDKIYPAVNGSVSLGCVSTGINFNDDIVYFSKQGLEAIGSSSMYSEQILTHRSSMVDSKMLAESNYERVKLAEWNGYLLCLIDSNIYLADSRQMFQNGTNETEYEWYYWELPNNITFIKEYRGEVFIGNTSGDLFKLTGSIDETNDTNENVKTENNKRFYDIESYWTTKKDDFDYPGYSKTTNKRGNVANVKNMGNDNIILHTIVDGTYKYKKAYSDAKGYFPYRIKDKKFKEIQLKFSSNKPFGLFSCTLEGFIAGYMKR